MYLTSRASEQFQVQLHTAAARLNEVFTSPIRKASHTALPPRRRDPHSERHGIIQGVLLWKWLEVLEGAWGWGLDSTAAGAAAARLAK
jgi:hypothetical protein